MLIMSAVVFFVLLADASSRRGKCNLFDKILQMNAHSHFLHASNTARRISVDIMSVTFMVVGNRLIIERQDNDESGGRLVLV